MPAQQEGEEKQSINKPKEEKKKRTYLVENAIKGVFGWGENRNDGKQGEENKVKNVVLHCLVDERKQERQKTGEKVFSLEPTFLILPNPEENVERKVL